MEAGRLQLPPDDYEEGVEGFGVEAADGERVGRVAALNRSPAGLVVLVEPEADRSSVVALPARYVAELDDRKETLVLIGIELLPIPQHPRIRHLGFLDDTDKFDAIAGAETLIMPSFFESLSMVALEAWALGRPVLANAKCDVLKGQ